MSATLRVAAPAQAQCSPARCCGVTLHTIYAGSDVNKVESAYFVCWEFKDLTTDLDLIAAHLIDDRIDRMKI